MENVFFLTAARTKAFPTTAIGDKAAMMMRLANERLHVKRKILSLANFYTVFAGINIAEPQTN